MPTSLRVAGVEFVPMAIQPGRSSDVVGEFARKKFRSRFSPVLTTRLGTMRSSFTLPSGPYSVMAKCGRFCASGASCPRLMREATFGIPLDLPRLRVERDRGFAQNLNVAVDVHRRVEFHGHRAIAFDRRVYCLCELHGPIDVHIEYDGLPGCVVRHLGIDCDGAKDTEQPPALYYGQVEAQPRDP